MTKQLVIGFTGHAQSGKDTAANILTQNGWKRVAYADPLRHLAYRSNPIVQAYTGNGAAHIRLADLVDREGWDQAKQHPDVRLYLQRLGTDGVRDVIGPTTWLNLAEQRIQQLHPKDVVVTDVRFPNEADLIRRLGGTIIRIIRPGHQTVKNRHPSESHQTAINPDYTIMNDGTINDLHNWVLDTTFNIGVDNQDLWAPDTQKLFRGHRP